MLAGVATLEEIETYWDILDVHAANVALDMKDKLDYLAHKEALRKGGSK